MAPYTLTDYDWTLHYWVDANVATPSEEPAGAIADGAPESEATVIEGKSFTGAVALLAGGAIEAICQRLQYTQRAGVFGPDALLDSR